MYVGVQESLLFLSDCNQFWNGTALFWAVTQRVVVILYRLFGTTYRSHLQGSAHFSSIWRRKPEATQN